jgi:DNA-binding transcriptional ArsR family regulator
MNGMDKVFRALADPTRRGLLDELFKEVSAGGPNVGTPPKGEYDNGSQHFYCDRVLD